MNNTSTPFPPSLSLFRSHLLTHNKQGNQLRRDLNVVVGGGRNWSIPAFLPVLLRYVSGPILAIIFSFAYPEFYTLRYDPLMITGFTLAHIGMVLIIVGCVAPRYYDHLIPRHRRAEGTEETMTCETKLEVVEHAVLPLHGGPAGDVDRGEAGLGDEYTSEPVSSHEKPPTTY